MCEEKVTTPANQACDHGAEMVNYDEAKLRELILYVAGRLQADPRAGAVKLNKILWWAECAAMRTFGRTITGAEFQKLENGPAPRRLVPVRKELVESGDARIEPTSYMGKTQQRLVPQRDADLGGFSPDELRLVDEVIDALWDKTAGEVSSASHGEIGWRIAEFGETIPVSTAFLADEAVVTPAMVDRAGKLARARASP